MYLMICISWAGGNARGPLTCVDRRSDGNIPQPDHGQGLSRDPCTSCIIMYVDVTSLIGHAGQDRALSIWSAHQSNLMNSESQLCPTTRRFDVEQCSACVYAYDQHPGSSALSMTESRLMVLGLLARSNWSIGVTTDGPSHKPHEAI
jgi:hypothetical protein